MSGYWKNNWDKRNKIAQLSDKLIHRKMKELGYELIRPATNGEDRRDKWDFLYVKDGVEEKVDHKTCLGVQESHRVLWEAGKLKVTKYARWFRHEFTLYDAERFWSHHNLQTGLNPGHERFYYII